MNGVAQKNQLRSTAIVMGVVGLVVIGMGLAMLLFDDEGRGSNLGGLLIRVGPSLPTLIVGGLGLVLVLARPALVWAALLGWGFWVLLGRQRSTSSKDS